MRARIALGLALLVAACTTGPPHPATSPKPSATVASPSPAVSPSPTLRPAGPVSFQQRVIAQGLEVPWSIAFAADGAAWLTERPGRVRVIRNGALLPDPALTLRVVTAAGCEDGLLGIAIREPYAYVFYTYAGATGNTNRVSRFTIQGDHLAGEQVILDGIPGGTCYHFGGRIAFGADGYLYVTTGEGFVAARAADPSNLNGKVIRIQSDGSGRQVYAWGFRNPEGITFDDQGRVYVSSNGPSGDLGLCCHDEVDLVEQGGWYGWPAWAAGTRTSYSGAGLPANRSGPLVESGTSTWAPSGIAWYSPAKDEAGSLYLAELRGQALRRFIVDPADPGRLVSQEVVLSGVGRLRDAHAAPDGCLWALTSNRDGRGSPRPGDDKVIALCAT
jgi:glucose/arabinose dehydrogenase